MAAKNLPNTTPEIFTGDVNINCSVPLFLSSANILIVNTGVTNVNIVAPLKNRVSKFIERYSNIVV